MILVVFLLLFFLAWLVTSPFYWKVRKVPSNTPWPLIGSLLPFFKGGMPRFTQELYSDFSDEPYCGCHFTIKPTLFIRSPELVVDIMVRNHDYFLSHALYTNSGRDAYGNNLFMFEGEQWKDMRAKLTTQFTPHKIKKNMYIMNRTLDRLCDHFQIESPGPVELKKSMVQTALDVATGFMFSIETDSLNVDQSGLIDCIVAFTNPRLTFNLFWSVISRELYDAMGKNFLHDRYERIFTKFIEEVTASRASSEPSHDDLFHYLIELKDKENQQPTNDEIFFSDGTRIPRINMKTIAGHVFTIFLGATETTSNTMTFCFYELAVNQDIQDKVRKELMNNLPDTKGHLEQEDLNNLPYTTMVLLETMRKHPVFNHVMRQCTRTYRIPSTGLTVDKGTTVLIPIYSIHHDPNYYPHPDKFIPERFTEEAKARRPQGTYLPFGLGPRTCIGMKFAMAEMMLILARLLPRFRFWKDSQCKDLEYDTFRFVVASKHPVLLKVECLDSDTQ